jgi:hypothetical protein
MNKEGFLDVFDLYYRTKLKNHFSNLEKYETEPFEKIHEKQVSKLLEAVYHHTQPS